MNNEISSSLLKLNNNDKNTNIDDTTFYEKFTKKEKKKKIDQFVKFKPKNISKNNGESSLKGAENKVKSILSSFLRTMRNEEKKDKINDRNPGIKMLLTKLSSKKINSIKIKKRQTKKSFNPGDNGHMTSLNKFYMNNIKSKDNENSSLKVTSDDINSNKTKSNKRYLNLKKYLSTSKLNINYKYTQNNEDYERIKSDRSSKHSKNTVNNYLKINCESKFKSNLSASKFQSMTKSDNCSKDNDSLIVPPDNNKNYFDKKKNFIKTNSVNVLSLYKKKLILGENPTDLSKKKISNKTAQCMSSKNILMGSEIKSNKSNNNFNKKKSFFSKNTENKNKYNNTFLIEPTKNNKFINKNKIMQKKYSTKNGFNFGKRISADYIPNQISNKLSIKVENHKRKTVQFAKKDLLNNSPKNKLHKVENVLKNLQEKLKNSIILRPQDLDLELNEGPQRKKAKKIKEKRTSKQEQLSSNNNILISMGS